jgi:hypothetical protein
VEGFREGDGGAFSSIQARNLRQDARVVYFKPCVRCGDPTTNRQGRERVGKFGLNSARKRDSFKHAGQKLDMADLD